MEVLNISEQTPRPQSGIILTACQLRHAETLLQNKIPPRWYFVKLWLFGLILERLQDILLVIDEFQVLQSYHFYFG